MNRHGPLEDVLPRVSIKTDVPPLRFLERFEEIA